MKPNHQAVLAYKHTELVKRFMRKMNLSEAKALQLFQDMLMFLFIAGTAERDAHIVPPTDVIDNAWHEFILYTRDYREFCHEFFGEMIDHQPFSSEVIEQQHSEEKEDGIETTIRYAETIFGELSENWVGPRAWCSHRPSCQVKKPDEVKIPTPTPAQPSTA